MSAASSGISGCNFQTLNLNALCQRNLSRLRLVHKLRVEKILGMSSGSSWHSKTLQHIHFVWHIHLFFGGWVVAIYTASLATGSGPMLNLDLWGLARSTRTLSKLSENSRRSRAFRNSFPLAQQQKLSEVVDPSGPGWVSRYMLDIWFVDRIETARWAKNTNKVV